MTTNPKTQTDTRIGKWYHARRIDDEGFLIVEITGAPKDREIPAKIVGIFLSEPEAIALCRAHNDR